MTNLNFKRFTGVALLLLGFSACNNELSEPQYSETSQSAQPKTELIYLDIITNGSEEMRLAQKVDGSGATTGVFLEEKDLAIQIGVRRKGQAQVATQLLRFAKIKGAPRARYTGLVNVPTGSGNEVEIAGIVLGEWTGDSKTEPQPSDVKFMTKSGSDFFQSIKPEHLLLSKSGVVRTKIPYIVDWTTAKLTVPEGGKQRIEPVTLYFKPNGTILRLQLLNSQTQKVKITQIKVKTNAFVEQWQYNFANGLVQENKLMGGELLSGTLPLEEQNYTWTLEQPITLNAASNASNAEPTKSQWIYTWVMGTKSFVGSRKIEFSLVAESGVTYNAVFKTSAELLNGQTMWVPLTISSSKVGADFGSAGDEPLVEEIVFNNPLSCIPNTGKPNYYAKVLQGTSIDNYKFVEPTSSFNYYNFSDASKKFKAGENIEGKRYFLPTIEEWDAIFPATGLGKSIELTSKEESIRFPGDNQNRQLASSYQGDGNALYAIRFKDDSNKFLMAYRYEFLGTFTTNSRSYIKITSRYLGAKGASTSITQVMQPDFWLKNNVNDVILQIPILGWKNSESGLVEEAGVRGTFWSATPRENPQYANRVLLDNTTVNGFGSYYRTSLFPVLLISRD